MGYCSSSERWWEATAKMPEVVIHVAGREFRIGCTEAEAEATNSAAEILNAELRKWADENEEAGTPQLLIISALNLASKIQALEGKVRESEQESTDLKTIANAAAADRRKLDDAEGALEANSEELQSIAEKAEQLAEELEEETDETDDTAALDEEETAGSSPG